MFAFEDRCARQINTVSADGVVDLEVISLAYLKIFKTVRRCRVHAASTRICRDMITQHNGYGLVGKRRHHQNTVKHLAFYSGTDIYFIDAKTRSALLSERLGY